MYDFSFTGILTHIATYSTFGLIYLIGGLFVFGMVAAFYWGARKAIIVGAIILTALFLYLSFEETGLTIAMLTNLLTFFRGILYGFIGLTVGAVLSHLIFNVDR